MGRSVKAAILGVWLILLVAAQGQAAAGVAGAGAAPPDRITSADVPVRVVVLYSSGVGYFEHAGTVAGSSRTELRFKANQINDVLKSLVLEDLDGGRVSTVVYPSQDPLSKTLRSFQVDITSNPSLGELLTQLRGAPVKVEVQAEQISGTILGLEKKPIAVGENGQVVDVWVMNLIAGGSFRMVHLDEVQKIDLEDAQLQEELQKALLALSQARDQDKKPVAIHFQGEGERRVRLGYVVETPIWKTSYRLIMPSKPEEKARLQGWAILENQTDNDWNRVQLRLVSGRPISFVQELYQSLYVSRPVVQPELYAGLRPQTYEAGMEPSQGKAMPRFGEAGKREESARARIPPPPSMRALAAPPPASAAEAERADKPIDPSASVISLAAAGKVGELFQYTVADVTLPRQRSAMLPIVTDDIEAERVSIYNRAVLPRNPLNGARLKNTTGKHLLQGPITVLDGQTYGGDARIDNLPPGQERLLSYAIDLQVQVNATTARQESAIQSGKIVKGVLELTRKQVSTQEYVMENKAEQDKVLIVEHPFRAGWKLVDTPTPLETTDTLYRFKDRVAAGKSAKLTVREENIQGQTIAILPTDPGTLEVYSRTGEIPPEVRQALVKAIHLKRALLDTQRQIQEKQQKVSEIAQEQQRIRSNMGAVSQNSQYYTRLLTKLNEQESAIEALQGEIEKLQRTAEQQRKDLETYLSQTTVG